MPGINKTVYVNAVQPVELRPPHGGRTYFFLQNNSAAEIYYDEGTQATQENGIAVGAGQFLELNASMGQAVPQGAVWLLGASASPTQQRVRVKEG
jgi:hypothetical protein